MKALAMVIILQLTRTISAEEVCDGSACLDPKDQTIIVAVGSQLQIRWGSSGIYPCSAECDGEKIQMQDGDGCDINFNTDTGDMTREKFVGDECKQTRDEDWRATTKNPPNEQDVFFLIERAHPDDSGEWTVKAKPEGNGERVLANAQVWVAAEPEDMSLFFADEEDNDFNATLTLTDGTTKSIVCKATRVRPAPTFIWTIDGSDINGIPELGNMTIEDSIQKSHENSNFTNQYLDVTQELKLPVTGWLDSKTLGCRVEIKDFNGNNVVPNAPDEKLNTYVTFVVPAKPVPSTEDEINPEGSFVAGEEGVLVIHFHSNPGPEELSWYPGDISGNLTSTETNLTVQNGRYTSEGWMDAVECVNVTGSASACDKTRSTSYSSNNAYIAILKVSELTEDDQNHMHNLTITNRIGTTSYSVRIQTIEVGLTTGAIAGIVVGCIVGVVLIAGAILLFIRHRNGKKSKKIRQRKKESRAEERTDRL